MKRQSSDKADEFLHYWRVIAGDMPTPENEYPFSAVIGRKHRFDFAFPEYRVAVEIEGNAWNVKGGGKHIQERDLEKYNIAAMLGWRVIRFSPSMLKKDPGTCIDTVVEAIEWNSTKKFSYTAGDTSASAVVAKKDMTPIMPSSTTSKRKERRSTKNSTPPVTSS